ncbi:Ras-related protein Rab-17 [Apodemus speciosus]|uniref:Ras-related protein Rab-17 n=1 Tax=Apodemus speciosus TaxID=105296 RepID=A0ABQ0EEK3_APOSI
MAQETGLPQASTAPGQPLVSKLVLLGSSSVGKTSLALRYMKQDFSNVLPTVGYMTSGRSDLDRPSAETLSNNFTLFDISNMTSVKARTRTEASAFFTKVVDLGSSSLKLEIWDTAGQEKYHSVCHLYFRGANAALLVYDITRKDSFHKAQQWLEDLEKEFHPGEVVVMLVGNKTDLSEEREVTFQVPCGDRQPEGALDSMDSGEGKEFAESKSLLFMETSAKLNHQVSEIFNTVAQELLQRAGDGGSSSQQDGEAVVLNQEATVRQRQCCAR